MTIPRGPVPVSLTFYHPPADNSPPYNYVEPPPPNQPPRNFTEAPHTVTLTDIRGRESSFVLSTDAFQVLSHVPTTTTHDTFSSDATVKETYYPEVEELLLRSVPGAHRVIIFDHTIRRQDPSAPRHPVHRAHVDQTPRAAAERVRLHVPDKHEAEEIIRLGGGDSPDEKEGADAKSHRYRYRIINVWRPINGAVESEPLAFAAASSVRDEDLVPVEHRYPHRTGETMAVRFHGDQRWMYLSGIEEHERLLLQCSDSWEKIRRRGRGEGTRVPHTAFSDPRTGEGAKPRESIEVRALVIG